MSAANNIAIVEDDASFSRALERLLQASGFETQTFTSAEGFLAGPAPGSYDCLILDVHLPGMSGLDLFHHLAASAPNRSAVFISAQDEDGVREEAARTPGCSFLRKPFVSAALLAAVRTSLQ